MRCFERIRFIVWFVRHERWNTKAQVKNWTEVNSDCEFLLTLLVLRDRPLASRVWIWNQVASPRAMFSSGLDIRLKVKWQEIWATTTRMLWQWRNGELYEEGFKRPHNPVMAIDH